MYFADPYAAWPRGTGENTNGLRQFFPKGTDFRTVRRPQLQRAQALLNDRRPRKCLGYRTSAEILSERLGVAFEI